MDKIAKAITAAVTGGSGAVGVALADGQITGAEYFVILAAVVVAFFGVWATPNAQPE
jgi:hypothetical protein